MNREQINVKVKNIQKNIQVSREDDIWYGIKKLIYDKEGISEWRRKK